MVKKKRQLCTIIVCMQHNNKYIKITDGETQKKILSKNYSMYVSKKIGKLAILKKKNNYLIKRALDV